jgi:hypothetical protein
MSSIATRIRASGEQLARPTRERPLRANELLDPLGRAVEALRQARDLVLPHVDPRGELAGAERVDLRAVARAGA